MAAIPAFDEMFGHGSRYGGAAGPLFGGDAPPPDITPAYRSIQTWLDNSPPELMAARRRQAEHRQRVVLVPLAQLVERWPQAHQFAIEDGAATMSLGSGIVADSVADAEWAECQAKGAFVTAGQRPFDLIETMAFDPEDGLTRLEAHLARMKASAERLGFTFDRHTARNELQAATFRLRGPRRIRLLLSPSGAIAIEAAPLPQSPPEAHVAIVPLPVASADFRLRHKTSARGFYDAARKAAGTFEVVFEDADGFLTEGSFTSLFVPRGDELATPPLRHGLLPGILRAALLESGRAIEAPLTRADLTDGFFIGNAVRGLIPAIVAVAKSVTRGV